MNVISAEDQIRIVAIGDIHGDLDALLRILIGVRVIDADGEWCGESAHLILMGDLNDRGPDSADVMVFVMRLEQEAASRSSHDWRLNQMVCLIRAGRQVARLDWPLSPFAKRHMLS